MSITRILTFLFTSFATLLTTWLVAQEKPEWSLEDCISYAYKHNIQLQRQHNSLTVQQNNIQQSKYNRLPTINGSTSFSNNYGRSINQVTNGYTNQSSYGISYGVGASVNLFNGFEKKHRIKKNEIELQAILADIEAQKENLALNITSIYLEILYAREEVELAKENHKIILSQQKQIKALVDAGKKPAGDLLEQQSQIAKAESRIVEAESKLSISYLSIYQLLDLKNEEAFHVKIPSSLDMDNLGESILGQSIDYESIVEARPIMNALKYRTQSAEQDIKIAKSSYFPSLSLSANIGSNYSNLEYDRKFDSQTNSFTKGDRMSFFDQADLHLNKSWGLNLSIPIFNRFQTRTSVKNAQIQVEDMLLQKIEEENKLYKELQQAYTNATIALKKYRVQEKTLEAHKETFRYISEKYNMGLVNSFDYNEALNNLTTSKSSMLQAKYEYLFRTKILDFYKGGSLKL